jgi:ribosomal protein L7Ae-like RNA K-turn-binding protein
VGVGETRRLLRAGRLRAVFFAEDASEAQLDKVKGLALGRGVPMRAVAGRDGLGRALGMGPVSVVGIMEGAFAERLLEVTSEGEDRK